MLGLFKRPSDTLVAANGRVGCPARAVDVDIEVCFDCPHIVEIGQDAGTPFVRCRPREGEAQRWWYAAGALDHGRADAIALDEPAVRRHRG